MENSPFVVGVALLALAFGASQFWYHYTASPREKAERRRAKFAKKAERKRAQHFKGA